MYIYSIENMHFALAVVQVQYGNVGRLGNDYEKNTLTVKHRLMLFVCLIGRV